MKPNSPAALIYILIAITTGCAATPAPHPAPYILGADISWIDEDEKSGTTYYDHDQHADLFQILKAHNFNYIRLRIFVNPSSPHGYAANSTEAFCDLEHTKLMAKCVRAAGMGFLLDFHYSDTWADPGHQFKPAAWENLDFPALKKAVYDHTHSVLVALKEQGTPPDMVQIGNEVSNGLLWPDGRAKDNIDNFADLLKSGIAATRDVDPSIKIVIHHHNGLGNKPVRAWLDNLIARNVRFDIIGLSCNSNGPASAWKTNFDDLAAHYPQFGLIAAEYSYQKRPLNDIIHNAPNHLGLGSFIWEPTRHHEAIFAPSQSNPLSTLPTTHPGHYPRTGRFDTNDFINLYPQMAKDYANNP